MTKETKLSLIKSSPVALRDVPPADAPKRFPTCLPTLDAALGGGLAAPAVVLIAGPTGAGKSKLARHLVRWADAAVIEVVLIDTHARRWSRAFLDQLHALAKPGRLVLATLLTRRADAATPAVAYSVDVVLQVRNLRGQAMRVVCPKNRFGETGEALVPLEWLRGS